MWVRVITLDGSLQQNLPAVSFTKLYECVVFLSVLWIVWSPGSKVHFFSWLEGMLKAFPGEMILLGNELKILIYHIWYIKNKQRKCIYARNKVQVSK